MGFGKVPHGDTVALDTTMSGAEPTDEQIDKTQYEPSPSASHGVRNVEAITLTWTKKTLAAAFIR